jgi:hypothetical protein
LSSKIKKKGCVNKVDWQLLKNRFSTVHPSHLHRTQVQVLRAADLVLWRRSNLKIAAGIASGKRKSALAITKNAVCTVEKKIDIKF